MLSLFIHSSVTVLVVVGDPATTDNDNKPFSLQPSAAWLTVVHIHIHIKFTQHLDIEQAIKL